MSEEYVCKECGKKLKTDAGLKQHGKDKHLKEICKECKKRFKTKKALRKHVWFKHKNNRYRKSKKLMIKPINENLRSFINKFNSKKVERVTIIQIRPKELPFIDLTGDFETEEERKTRLREERELGR